MIPAFVGWYSSVAMAVSLAIPWSPREYQDGTQLPGNSLVDVDLQIQKALHIATEFLGMFRRLRSDPRHSRYIQIEIEGVTRWLTFLIEENEHIVTGVTQQQPELWKLVTRVFCENCRTNSKHGVPIDSQQVLRSRPIWEKQLATLRARTKRVGMELFEQSCASSTLSRFPRCLWKLVQVLHRLEQYLGYLGAAETRIETEYSTEQCAGCGAAIDPKSELEAAH